MQAYVTDAHSAQVILEGPLNDASARAAVGREPVDDINHHRPYWGSRERYVSGDRGGLGDAAKRSAGTHKKKENLAE